AAASARGIPVTNVPGYSTQSVAQLTFALLLELCHRAGLHSDAVHAGRWSSCSDFSFTPSPLVELAGRTMGLIGFGSIGQAVAPIAQAFGLRVLAHTRSGRMAAVPGVTPAALDELLRESDVVSLHCPLTADNRGLIGREQLARMKPGAFLLNTARGPLVEEGAVADALRSGHLGGFGADVLSAEPPPADHPLLGAPRCVLTPHLAWATREARQRLMGEVAANLQAFLQGQRRNVVNA
ncbi:MAG: D-2-hydroxyacid dehydrogenase, partial [Gemmatimonadales bacterium]